MFTTLVEHINAAIREGLKRGIKMNTLIIDEELAATRGFLVKSYQSITEVPPMMLGMATIYSSKKDLPEDVEFMLTYKEWPRSVQAEADRFSDRVGLNILKIFDMQERCEVYFRDENDKICLGIIDSIDIVNHTIVLHKPIKDKKFRVNKAQAYTFTFKEYGIKYSLSEEELSC